MRSLIAATVFAAFAAPSFGAEIVFGEDLNVQVIQAIPNSNAARNMFLGRLSSVGTQTFEGYSAGQFFPSAGSLTFGSLSTTATITGGTIFDSMQGGRYPVSGTNYLATIFSQRITFSAPVTAFGLYVVDANEVDNDPTAVTVNGQTLTQAQIDLRPFDSVDGIFRIVTERSPGVFEVLFSGGTFAAPDFSAMFVGLIDRNNPFSNIILVNGTSGLDVAFQDQFGYDNMMIGTVSEPGTLALLGLSLAGLAAARRRKQAQ